MVEERVNMKGLAMAHGAALRPDFWATLRVLLRMGLAEMRTSWPAYVILNATVPLGMLFFVRFVATDLSPRQAVQLIAGNLTISLVFLPMIEIASQFAVAVSRHEFDLYNTLPISKWMIVFSYGFAKLILMVPSMVVVLFAAAYYLGIPVHWHPLLPLLVTATGFSMVGLGAAIGLLAGGVEAAGMIANVLMIVILLLSPVMAPAENFPAVLRYTGMILPTTYAADGLRQALEGHVALSGYVDAGVVLAFAALCQWIVGTHMKRS